VYVQTPAQLAAENRRGIAKQLTPFWTLQRGLLLVSFIAVLSTLLLVGYQRRRELGLLAAIGMTPGELRRMVLSESVAVGLVGAVLGTVFGVLGFEAMRDAGPVLIGYHDPFRIDLSAPFVYGFVGLVVVLLAGAWPARTAARLPILDALRYE
jgi:putative ABC transport system permease protein